MDAHEREAIRLAIEPDPGAEERAALEQALAGARVASAPEKSAWWRAGVRENVEDAAGERAPL